MSRFLQERRPKSREPGKTQSAITCSPRSSNAAHSKPIRFFFIFPSIGREKIDTYKFTQVNLTGYRTQRTHTHAYTHTHSSFKPVGAEFSLTQSQLITSLPHRRLRRLFHHISSPSLVPMTARLMRLM